MAASVGGETSFQVADTRKPCQKTFVRVQPRHVRAATVHRKRFPSTRPAVVHAPASILAFHRLGFARLDIREARIRRGHYLPGGSGSWNFFLFVRSLARSLGGRHGARADTRGDHRHLVISMLGTGATRGGEGRIPVA